MFDYYSKALFNYDDFSGRASRKEFWSFLLVHSLLYLSFIVLGITFKGWGLRIAFALFIIYSVMSAVPALALTVRRLHDIGLKGTVAALAFFPPVIGLLLLLLICTKKGDDGVNSYGLKAKSIEEIEEEEDEFV